MKFSRKPRSPRSGAFSFWSLDLGGLRPASGVLERTLENCPRQPRAKAKINPGESYRKTVSSAGRWSWPSTRWTNQALGKPQPRPKNESPNPASTPGGARRAPARSRTPGWRQSRAAPARRWDCEERRVFILREQSQVGPAQRRSTNQQQTINAEPATDDQRRTSNRRSTPNQQQTYSREHRRIEPNNPWAKAKINADRALTPNGSSAGRWRWPRQAGPAESSESRARSENESPDPASTPGGARRAPARSRTPGWRQSRAAPARRWDCEERRVFILREQSQVGPAQRREPRPTPPCERSGGAVHPDQRPPCRQSGQSSRRMRRLPRATTARRRALGGRWSTQTSHSPRATTASPANAPGGCAAQVDHPEQRPPRRPMPQADAPSTPNNNRLAASHPASAANALAAFEKIESRIILITWRRALTAHVWCDASEVRKGYFRIVGVIPCSEHLRSKLSLAALFAPSASCGDISPTLLPNDESVFCADDDRRGTVRRETKHLRPLGPPSSATFAQRGTVRREMKHLRPLGPPSSATFAR